MFVRCRKFTTHKIDGMVHTKVVDYGQDSDEPGADCCTWTVKGHRRLNLLRFLGSLPIYLHPTSFNGPDDIPALVAVNEGEDSPSRATYVYYRTLRNSPLGHQTSKMDEPVIGDTM